VLTALIAWLAGAATAVAVGLFALSSIDFGLSPRPAGQPLGAVPADGASPSAIAEPTPGGTTGSPSPSPSASRSPNMQPNGVERTFTSVGGTVVARCMPTGAYLVSWSPAQGFHSDDVRRGPALTASVGFESYARKYTVSVMCAKGMPQGTVRGGDR
jgi:hypothetical protein